ncbi:bifunctional folylpolyglutamate synthase/dihydrofolate synthase [Apilactobacillus apisilvae]|uniref:tetrahydrofolate synthase n=1 Tax=Apilactobacillus apisilvae TaxID=2923364 RepID=A0ABY4PH62_9LACO|nr:folylpolyglutamate synthase/dihydrofolate synthase family protein [Apilactobacillus apisilvae]UQS85173.1 bifunctional folylpolyglutamate synthase/dihydrofolate synthase [Apilactobacillus apisilvae]
MNYEDAINFIHGRHKFSKHPTLDVIKSLLFKLNNPQDKINGIHIAGTNGKGSTLTFLRNIFQAEGLNVGSFTSPFLIKFNERISVNGIPIKDSEIIDLINLIKPIVEQMDDDLAGDGPTEFEIVTTMMFLYFAKNPVDIVLVEVGIGGLLDSTNVFTPKVSVITTIGYDHMKILGNTLSEIAAQKAGIVKEKVDCVVGKLPTEALNVIKSICEDKRSKLFIPDYNYCIHKEREGSWSEKFLFSDNKNELKDLTIKMLGNYQIDNAGCAIEAYVRYKALNNEPINVKVIKKGLLNSFWAGRFEKVSVDPLVVIDGAHNQPAIVELADLLKNHFHNYDIYIVLAILDDKQYMNMINILAKIKNVHITLTEFNGPNNRKSTDMSEVIGDIYSENKVNFVPQWKLAIMDNAKQMSADDLLLITGSLYFISDVRKLFY